MQNMMSRERHSTPRTLTRKEQKTSSAELMAAEEFQILPKKKEHQPSSLLPQPTRSNAHKYLIIMAITWKATTTTAVLAVGLLLLTPSIDGFSVIATKVRRWLSFSSLFQSQSQGLALSHHSPPLPF